MGHDIRAFADEDKRIEITGLRLFPREAFVDGNVYDVPEATDFRRSCSGDGRVAKFRPDCEFVYPVEPNQNTRSFLDTVSSYFEKFPEVPLVYIKFS